ncbi:segregation and condensation protein A [Marinicellulosiphila megalodicopiae]|uniref:segregation and condensation protein A n=1 Tax=Marinicellulosiphila megalodicopiae TaxID=2724896 RepID=UPI003BB09AA4
MSDMEIELESDSDEVSVTDQDITKLELKTGLRLSDAKQDAQARQSEMPFAIVAGKEMIQLPLDLFIPPDCLEVFLDSFEGPLDLLLYLIKKQNIDVLQINVFEITKQYMAYVELMQSVNLELAGEYLVMAAMLTEIKSRILLPRNEEGEEEDDGLDPRAELIRRLQEYEQFKTAAQNIEEMPRTGRDIFIRTASKVESDAPLVHPDIEMEEIMRAFKFILERAEMEVGHEVAYETLSTRERMSQVLERLKGKAFVPYISLFDASEGRLGVVVTFLAIMELAKEQLVDLVQNELFGPIHVKAKGAPENE